MLKRSIINSFNWDFLRLSASSTCVIHCLFLPILVSAIPMMESSIVLSEIGENLLILIGVIVGFVAVRSGYFNHHRRKEVFLPFYFLVIFFCLGFIGRSFRLWADDAHDGELCNGHNLYSQPVLTKSIKAHEIK